MADIDNLSPTMILPENCRTLRVVMPQIIDKATAIRGRLSLGRAFHRKSHGADDFDTFSR
jgi:hypothetical protein